MKGLISSISNILDYLNPNSNNFLLNGIINTLSTFLSYINPFSQNFFGYKIIDLLGDLLESIFVPSESRITAITNTVNNKFAFVDTIKTAINSLLNIINNIGNAPKLEIDIGSTKYTQSQKVTVIDLSFYQPYKNYGDVILTGFIYLFFLWRLFITLPNVINATGGGIANSYDVFYKQERGSK